MFDLHSHVLPSIDDGAKNVEMSIQMLKESYKQGVRTLAATPHCVTSSESGIEKFLAKRKKAYEILKEATEGMTDIPKIILGGEVYLGSDMSELSNLSSLCYGDTKYILLELVDSYSPSIIAEWVYNIKIKGLKPVIAHVDRYHKCLDIVDELVPLDVIFQLNAARFLTMGGRGDIKKIFKRYDKFLISSDMHNVSSRPCNIENAKAIVEKKFPAFSQMLFNDTGRMIIENR